MFEDIVSHIEIYNKNRSLIINRSLIVFKRPRQMTNDFFNNYIFGQSTSSEFYNNLTITAKILPLL